MMKLGFKLRPSDTEGLPSMECCHWGQLLSSPTLLPCSSKYDLLCESWPHCGLLDQVLLDHSEHHLARCQVLTSFVISSLPIDHSFPSIPSVLSCLVSWIYYCLSSSLSSVCCLLHWHQMFFLFTFWMKMVTSKCLLESSCPEAMPHQQFLQPRRVFLLTFGAYQLFIFQSHTMMGEARR
jgi:hypothetical protein